MEDEAAEITTTSHQAERGEDRAEDAPDATPGRPEGPPGTGDGDPSTCQHASAGEVEECPASTRSKCEPPALGAPGGGNLGLLVVEPSGDGRSLGPLHFIFEHVTGKEYYGDPERYETERYKSLSPVVKSPWNIHSARLADSWSGQAENHVPGRLQW